MDDSGRTELLANMRARLLLGAYASPRGPSEVARMLELPANTVHYWTKRLLEADLVEVAGVQGRVRSYRSKDPSPECVPGACLPFVQGVMGALSKVVLGAAQRYDLTPGAPQELLPDIGLHELRLTKVEVENVVAALQEALGTASDHANDEGEVFTVGFVVAPGSLSQHF